MLKVLVASRDLRKQMLANLKNSVKFVDYFYEF